METFADAALQLFGGLGPEADGSVAVRLIFLLVLAVSLSGLAWLAYKRPALFVERTCPRLAVLLSALLLIGLTWNAAELWHSVGLPYTELILVFGGGASYFFFLYRILHRYAVAFEPAAMDHVARGSVAARQSHPATRTRSSMR